MDCQAYEDLMLDVVSCAQDRYTHSDEFDWLDSDIREKDLHRALALAIVECIDNDDDMWTIIHHTCHDVCKAFYAGNLEYRLSTPYDLFLHDCRNRLIGNLEFLRTLMSI